MRSETTSVTRSSHGAAWTLVAVLGITAAIYLQTLGFPYVNFDDPTTVYENRHVASGLSWSNLRWAFEIHGPREWHPLSWISHQLDASLFGAATHDRSAGGHHATNVLLHLVNVALVYAVFRRLTGQAAPALLSSAVFGVHPLNVESVAWVAERGIGLSAMFFLCGILAYERYVRTRGAWIYVGVCALHAAGLMAHPVAVTFPCVLMLLDIWPLRRWECKGTAKDHPLTPTLSPADGGQGTVRARVAWSVIEKLPLFALTAASCVLTLLCQQEAGALTRALSLDVRVTNAVVAYALYLWNTVAPAGLCAFYTHPGFVDATPMEALRGASTLAAALLAVISLICIVTYRRRPWFLVGWLWFLGMLVPMIGLVQAGEQQRADRFTYLPNLGLLLAVTAGLPWDWLDRSHRRATRLIAVAIVVCLACLAYQQTSTWRDGVALFEQALSVNDRNHWAHLNLGDALLHRGDRELAEQHFLAALAIDPNLALACYNLGVVNADRGDRRAAAHYFDEAVRLDPANSHAWVRRGALWGSIGRLDLAEEDFRRASEVDPENLQAPLNIGLIREYQGNHAAAREIYRQILMTNPHFAPAAERLQQLQNSRPAPTPTETGPTP